MKHAWFHCLLRASLVLAVWFLPPTAPHDCKISCTHSNLCLWSLGSLQGQTTSTCVFNSLRDHQLQNRQRQWLQNSQLQFLVPGIFWSIMAEGGTAQWRVRREGLPSVSLCLLYYALGSLFMVTKCKTGRNLLFRKLRYNSYTIQFTHLKCTTQ